MAKEKKPIPPLKHLSDLNFKIKVDIKDYDYQLNLTESLLKEEPTFDQKWINKVVLWKVDRYAQIENKDTFVLLKKLHAGRDWSNVDTDQILNLLLRVNGIGLPMASTILRFANPETFQIIDQRVFRILYSHPFPNRRRIVQIVLSEDEKKNQTAIDKAIKQYKQYLIDLQVACISYGIEPSEADRILYMADIDQNPEVPLKKSKSKNKAVEP